MTIQDSSSISDLLAQASRLSNQQIGERLKPTRLAVDSWRILTLLEESKGMSMGELAEKLVINNPTLTKMIDRMVNDNFVYRVTAPKDRRIVLICATDLGKEVYQNASKLVRGSSLNIDYETHSSSELANLLLKFIKQLRG
ncbi:MAG: MarR family transcriptional regulator [Deltaproteobacteria bacterium]|nr:MarR family transcriptional regulator [Deltaproteobacteria bacterium]MBT3716358.1 MarR family transcriptional regulator [Deltaproteobacteria bacterium]